MKQFKKVYVKAGERIKVNFELTHESFASYDPELCMWTVEEGYYDIIAATSSDKRDFITQKRIYLEGPSPYSYGLNSSIKSLYENDQIKNSIKEIFKEKGLDFGIIESNYQYTSSKTLGELILEILQEEKKQIQNDQILKDLIDQNSDLKDFLKQINRMKRL